MDERLPRKLAAILYADVAGYSRLTGEDEDGTHRRLSAYLDAITHLVEQHQGKVLHYAGDALLADFSTASNALGCAVAIQQELAQRNKDLPAHRMVQFRIGVNLGEVIVDRNEIYGDGVNIAARLQALAAPGGICVSGTVYDAIGKKSGLRYESLGEQSVKNIDEPVRAYRVLSGAASPDASAVESITLKLADKLSIAVLPFINMSGDSEQEYFADGITEDITTALAHNRSLVVVAWHSAFAYRDKAIGVKRIANELGCRYVVEGSVRRRGQRVRINAQLIEANTGNHLWAERYERQLEDVFALQDEIALSIAGAIDPELAASESKRARAKAPENLDAWDYYQQGLWHMYKFTVEGLAEAKTLLERAIDLDENFAPAYARLSYVHIQHAWYGAHEFRDDALSQALAGAKRAVTLDNKDALGHFALGRVYALQHQHDAAVLELESAIDLNPSFAQAYFALGQVLVFANRSSEALPFFEQAIRLSPHDPHMWTFLQMKGMAYYKLGQLEDAERCVREAVRQPNATHWPFATLLSILGQENKLSEAATVMRELLEKKPGYSCSYAQKDSVFAGRPTLGEFIRPYVAGLRKAGLPE